jgi:hypothetical protein
MDGCSLYSKFDNIHRIFHIKLERLDQVILDVINHPDQTKLIAAIGTIISYYFVNAKNAIAFPARCTELLNAELYHVLSRMY